MLRLGALESELFIKKQLIQPTISMASGRVDEALMGLEQLGAGPGEEKATKETNGGCHQFLKNNNV